MGAENKHYRRGENFSKELPRTMIDYFKLRPYRGSVKLFERQTEIQQFQSPSAEMYYKLVKDQAWKKAKDERKFPEAINIVETNLEHLDKEGFGNHDNKALSIRFLRRLGRIYEYWATDEEKDKPFDDNERITHFLMAAYYYMLGDLELGIMTEYADRVGECLRGVGLFDEALRFSKAFWGNNIIVMNTEQVEALRGKRHNNISVAEQSGASRIEHWFDENPDLLKGLTGFTERKKNPIRSFFDKRG